MTAVYKHSICGGQYGEMLLLLLPLLLIIFLKMMAYIEMVNENGCHVSVLKKLWESL